MIHCHWLYSSMIDGPRAGPIAGGAHSADRAEDLVEDGLVVDVNDARPKLHGDPHCPGLVVGEYRATSPYSVSFASAIASASVPKVRIDATGPNVSSE